MSHSVYADRDCKRDSCHKEYDRFHYHKDKHNYRDHYRNYIYQERVIIQKHPSFNPAPRKWNPPK